MRRTIIAGCYSNILLVSLCLGQQRVAPGVPPQHYQPPPQYDPQQQHIPNQQVHRQGAQQVPAQQVHQGQVPAQQVHQGQVPAQQVHQGQVPAQQVHQGQVPAQQVHQGQVPAQQPHGHHHPQSNQILNTANIAAEKQHIQEHMEVPIDTSKMTDQELQFHYFKMHDADNNNKLDGCELIKSLIHWHEQGRKEHGTTEQAPEHKIFHDEELLKLIEPILGADDGNNDGFIDYPEFIRAQKKAQVQQQQQQQQQQHTQQAPPLR